jgi:hypothetical protein
MLDTALVLLAVVFLALCEALVHGFDRLARGGSR